MYSRNHSRLEIWLEVRSAYSRVRTKAERCGTCSQEDEESRIKDLIGSGAFISLAVEIVPKRLTRRQEGRGP